MGARGRKGRPSRGQNLGLLCGCLALGLLLCVSSGQAASGHGNGKIVLGSKKFVGKYGKGFGRRKPSTIFNGGDPNGLVTEIRWEHWGASVATARGRGSQFKPEGGYYSKHVIVRLRALKLGRCPGSSTRAYTQLMAQFQRRPGGKFGRWFLWSGAKSICSPPY